MLRDCFFNLFNGFVHQVTKLLLAKFIVYIVAHKCSLIQGTTYNFVYFTHINPQLVIP